MEGTLNRMTLEILELKQLVNSKEEELLTLRTNALNLSDRLSTSLSKL